MNTTPISVAPGGGTTLNVFGATPASYTLPTNTGITFVLIGTIWYAINYAYTAAVGGDLTGTLPNPALADTPNVEGIARIAVTQAVRRHGSAAWTMFPLVSSPRQVLLPPLMESISTPLAGPGYSMSIRFRWGLSQIR